VLVRLLSAMIGAAVGCAFVVTLEIAVLLAMQSLFNDQLSPKGFGWVVMPIAGAIFGAQVGYFAGDGFLSVPAGLSELLGILRQQLQGASNDFRLWLAFSILWMIGTVVFFTVFDPVWRYGSSEREWLKFVTLLFGPIAFGFVAARLFGWARRRKNRVVEHKRSQPTPAFELQPVSVIRRILAEHRAAGQISEKDAADIEDYYDKLLIKHAGNSKAARLELIAWLEVKQRENRRA
jgi:hypothetical protein